MQAASSQTKAEGSCWLLQRAIGLAGAVTHEDVMSTDRFADPQGDTACGPFRDAFMKQSRPVVDRPSFLLDIDEDEEGIDASTALTLRALREDALDVIQCAGLTSRMSSRKRPGRVVCVIVTASQLLRRPLLERDPLRHIIIDDRGIFKASDVNEEALTALEREGHIITARAACSDPETGRPMSNMVADLRIQYLLHEIFDRSSDHR